MARFDSLIFDLDGTLWDTCTTCAVAWNRVLERNKISFREITAEDVRGVTGKPHDECIRTVFSGLPEEDLQILIRETILEDNHWIQKLGGFLYKGVSLGIPSLAKHYRLFIVSNCQSGYVETFYNWSGLEKFFVDFECWGNTGKAKTENTTSLIKRNSIQSPLFIGDTLGDQEAAQANSIPFAFVKYGFGKVNQSDYAFNEFHELVELLAPKTEDRRSHPDMSRTL